MQSIQLVFRAMFTASVALCLVLSSSAAEARIRGRIPLPAVAIAAAAPAAMPAACCPAPCIRYRDLSCGACCDPCAPAIKTCLVVCDPCTGCATRVPVCLPACCTGCPVVFSRGTIIGSGLVRYTWCCGFSVTMRFDRCGDLLVIYRG